MSRTTSIEGADVATFKLAYVQAFKDRHGTQRFYYRRDGRRIALPGRPGEPEFMRAYEDAAASHTGASTIEALAPAPGTFNALALSYHRSAAFTMLRKSSQKTFRPILDRWCAEHGDKRVTHLKRHHVAEHISKAVTTSGPHAANTLLSRLRVLMRFAVENDWRRDDPTIGVRKVRAKSEGFKTWTKEDIAAFEKRWPKGSRERLALALLLYTGQRRGDMIRMGRQHVSGDTIRVVQNKTGVSLVIPMHKELQRAINATPKSNLTFLTTAWGKPFTAPGFGNWFREACDAAGLKGLSAHGLRKAAATRLADAGCSASQIGAITGHRTLTEVTRYTRAADQERMARDAIERLR